MATERPLRVLGICGSLRRQSSNMAALRKMGELMASAGMKLEITSIADLPLYNDDIRDKGYPEPAARLRQAIAESDAVYFASPEYNFSVTGVMKNAIDWSSRPPDQPWRNKPVAMLTVSEGPLGGPRGQYDLRRMLVGLSALPLPRPEVYIGNRDSKIDAQGHVTDATTIKFMTAQVEAFKDWIVRMKRAFGPE